MPSTKILLVQLFSNGDCLYATAVAKQIKQDFPGCRLSWAVSVSCRNILVGNPYIDEIIEVAEVAKNDVPAYRKYIKGIFKKKEQGIWDEVFITHIMDTNQANYDGSIRSAIFRGYNRPITVDVVPVLRLLDSEIQKAYDFALQYRLSKFRNVILFEFAPQSGQSAITQSDSICIAEELTKQKDTVVILSSAQRIKHTNAQIIDGSVLSIRETAALTRYCSFLIGCSSGITWLTTSDGAKRLPMVQLLNPYTNWVNPLSRDFKLFGLDDTTLIELIDFDVLKVANCVSEAMRDFEAARKKYAQPMPLHFRTTRNIVYNLLCYLEFSSIKKHIYINREVYGNRLSFYKEVALGFLEFPFKLIKNFFRKKIFNS